MGTVDEDMRLSWAVMSFKSIVNCHTTRCKPNKASIMIIDMPVVDATTSDTAKDIMLKYYAAGRI